MDLSSINKAKLNDNNVAFSGSKFENNDAGERYFRVFPQNIELNDNEELGVELIRMSENKSKLEPYGFDAVSLKPLKVEADEDFKNGKKSYLDIDLKKYRLKNAAEFGFRYVVYDKNTKETKRAYTDSTGTVIKHNNMEFTVASSRQGNSRNEGPMEHIYTDSWNTLENIKQKAKKRNPSISDEHAIDDFRRNHVNKAGGTINGITEKLDTELASYPLIMTTPLIGGGGVSSHGYHPKNHFQVTDGLGTKQDFLNLQKACFERGKGYVLDGAFTSQGYEGMQLNHAMKWYNSPFKYWFKNPQELGFELGVLSDTDNSHTGIRVVNPMGVEGYKYDSSMPTYIQFYDTRLAKNQLDDFGALIKDYDLAAADDDPYEISTWHDGILPNYFEVDPHSKSVYGMTYGTLDPGIKKAGSKMF